MSNEEIVRNAVRNPTPDAADQVFNDVITPKELKSIVPHTVEKMDSGVASEELSKDTVGGILDVVEEEVLGKGVDFIMANFGNRISELVTNNIGSIMERVGMVFFGG